MPEPHIGYTGETLAAARRAVRLVLSEAGIEEAEREARLLLEHATRLSPERLLLDEARRLDAVEARILNEVIARRLAHEPLSRIRGERDFYGRTFMITPAVLDPRPETETVVDLVLQWVDRNGGRNRVLEIIDIGTGRALS